MPSSPGHVGGPGVPWMASGLLPAPSYHHQISCNENLSLEMLRSRFAPGLVRDSIDGGYEVRQDEGFNPSCLCDAADIFNRRMVGLHVGHVSVEVGRHALGDPIADVGFHRRQIHGFMHQEVGALGQPSHSLERRSVAGKYDRAISKVEAVSQCWPHRWMLDDCCSNLHVLILQDVSRC